MIGFLNINKPVGMTSAQVVAKVKKILSLPKSVKIGHMGTLDMLASGVLPIAIGRATRLFDFFLSKKKYYRATFTFGYMTDSLDSDGNIIKTSEIIPNKEEIESALGNFLGEIMQVPPMFSAKNINGRRASDIARSGEIVELKPSKITIYEFKLVENKGNSFVFDIECSAGTYIRSLCRDLADSLGSCATMTALCRTRAGVFLYPNAILLDDVNKDAILPPDVVLESLEKLEFDTDFERDTLLNGKKLLINREQGLYAFYSSGVLRGLCEIDEQHNARMKTWL